jgi:preprotein translocase subunit SecD
VINLARDIQAKFGITRFTAFNDRYHQKNSPRSKHAQGLALDFTVPNASSAGGITSQLNNMFSASGIKARALNEYANPSAKATGGHIHVEFTSEAEAKKYMTLSTKQDQPAKADLNLPPAKTNKLVKNTKDTAVQSPAVTQRSSLGVQNTAVKESQKASNKKETSAQVPLENPFSKNVEKGLHKKLDLLIEKTGTTQNILNNKSTTINNGQKGNSPFWEKQTNKDNNLSSLKEDKAASGRGLVDK